MKLDWQWPAAVVFSIVFLTIGILVYFNKISHDALYGLLVWLIPSPMQAKAPNPVTSTTIEVKKEG